MSSRESSCLPSLVCCAVILAVSLSSPPLALHTADMSVLASVEVEYITMPGWSCNIEVRTPHITSHYITSHMMSFLQAVRTFEDLPPNAQAYVLKVEELLGLKGNPACVTTHCLPHTSHHITSHHSTVDWCWPRP